MVKYQNGWNKLTAVGKPITITIYAPETINKILSYNY